MPTIVGILIFMSMINTTYECFKARKIFIFQYLRFYEQFEISCSVELSMKKSVISSGPDDTITSVPLAMIKYCTVVLTISRLALMIDRYKHMLSRPLGIPFCQGRSIISVSF